MPNHNETTMDIRSARIDIYAKAENVAQRQPGDTYGAAHSAESGYDRDKRRRDARSAKYAGRYS